MCCSDPHEGVRKVESLAMWVIYKYLDMVFAKANNSGGMYDEYNHGLMTGRFDEAFTNLMGCTKISQGMLNLWIADAIGTGGLPTDKAKHFATKVIKEATIVGSCTA